MTEVSLRAEVLPARDLEHFVIVPRPGYPARVARAFLEEQLRLRLGRSAQGLTLPAHQADSLLLLNKHGVLEWRGDTRRYAEGLARARANHEVLKSKVGEIVRGSRSAAEALLGGLSGVNVLDDHQVANVAAMALDECYGLCVFDEQGLGKTVTLIFAFDLLVARDLVDIVLVVAPKSMVGEWPVDLRRFKRDLYRAAVITGSREEKKTALASKSDFLVTNFETVVGMEAEVSALLRMHNGRAMLVVDESYSVKNLDAKRTRAIKRIRSLCDRAYVLCGTPAPNAPQDLVQQFNIVDFGLTFSGVSVPDDRQAARAVVQRAIEDHGVYIRHLKPAALPQLPGKRFSRVFLPMEPLQRRLYEGALQGLVLSLQEVDDRQFQRRIVSFLARRTALLQICANPTAIDRSYTETSAKLKALDELLEKLIVRQGEKVVLWSFYTASIEAIVSRYQRYSPVRYDGTVSDVDTRREAVRRFQEDDETMLFVGNPAAAGAGLTLHRARFAIYESMSNQAAHYLQSLDRIHRRGQKRDVEYLVLLCDGTIEVMEYDRLMMKEQAAHELLRDEVDQPATRDTMLRELTEAAALLRQEPSAPATNQVMPSEAHDN